MDPRPTTTRRQFIATTTAAAGAFTIVPRHVLGGQRFVAPSDKVNVAIIGAGGQGRTNARALFQEDDCQIIALADPAEEWDLSTWYYGGKSGRGPVQAEIEKHYSGKTPNHKCTVYEDFRVMLEKEKAIDAVLIATPDHLHAYVSILAMKSGKHVYCEKPLTHNIREARLVARVAKETGVATQMGNHGRSGEGHRQTVEWITDGAIGAVREVHGWSGNARSVKNPGPGEGPSVQPSRLNWDLWLGPRAARPYSGKYAPFVWRWIWDFGNGTMPDMAPHHFDPAFNALGLDVPITMEARGSDVDPETTTGSHLVTYQYGAKGNRGPLTLYLVRQRPQTAHAARHRSGRPAAAARRGRQRPHVRRREGHPHVRRLVRDAAPAPDGTAPRVQAPAEDHPARRRAPCRLAAGLQGRHTCVQQLRLRRAAHRVHPPRHAGAPDGQGGEVGRPGHEGHQRAGSAALHRGELPQGVGTAGLTLDEQSRGLSVERREQMLASKAIRVEVR